jgi:hypothetical protein
LVSGLEKFVPASADEPDFIPVAENLQLLPDLGLDVAVLGVKPLEFLHVGCVDLFQREASLV